MEREPKLVFFSHMLINFLSVDATMHRKINLVSALAMKILKKLKRITLPNRIQMTQKDVLPPNALFNSELDT